MADTIKTRDELIERAGSILNVSGNDELEQEDYDKLDGIVDPLLARLSADGIVTIDDPEQIEIKYFLPLALLLANEAAPDFGQPYSTDVNAEGERQLRRVASSPQTYESLQAEYF